MSNSGLEPIRNYKTAAPVPNLVTARPSFRPLKVSDTAVVQKSLSQRRTFQYLTKHVSWPHQADSAPTFIHNTALPALQKDPSLVKTRDSSPSR